MEKEEIDQTIWRVRQLLEKYLIPGFVSLMSVEGYLTPCIVVNTHGVITLQQKSMFCAELQKLTFDGSCLLVLRFHGMSKDLANPMDTQKMRRRLEDGCIDVRKIVIDEANHQVMVEATVLDLPEVTVHQGIAIDELMAYIRPYNLLFNGTLEEQPSV